jgi:hypothetical protein
MGKVVKFIAGVALAVVGAVTGNFQLILAGAALAGSALIKPKAGKRRASEAVVQTGEVARQAIVGRAATAGSLVDAFNYGGKYGTDWEVLVLALADHRCDALEGFYVNDAYVAYGGDGMVAGYNNQLQVFWRSGTETQTVPAILTGNGPGWTANDNGAGVAHVVVAYKADASDAKNPVWPNGRPKFLWVVRGALCYDPRKDSSVGGSGAHRWANPATWEWSENTIVTRYKFARGFYACDRVTQPDQLLVGRGLSEVEAPPVNLFARANICDEVVDGEARYRCGGLIAATETYLEVEEDFAAACAGTISQPEGAVEIDPGAAKAAVLTITDKDLVVGSKVKRRWFLGTNDREWINTVVASYIDPAFKWQPQSAPVRRVVGDVIADRGAREQVLTLGFVQSGKQAGRVGEIVRRLGRLFVRAELVLPPRFCELEEGDWINWQSDRWLNGATYTFRIEAWGSDKSWQHSVQLRQISATAYSDTAPLVSGAVAVQQPAPGAIGQPPAGDWALAAGSLVSGGVATPALILTGANTVPNAELLRVEYRMGAAAPGAGDIWVEANVAGPDTRRVEIPAAAGGIYRVAVSLIVDGVQGDRRVLGPVTAGQITYPDGIAIDTLQPGDASATRSDNILPNGNLADLLPTGLPRKFFIGTPALVTLQNGVAGVAREPARYLRMSAAGADIRTNDGAVFSVDGGGRLFFSMAARIKNGPAGLISIQFLEYDNGGAIFPGSATINWSPQAADVWEELRTAITLQITTARVLVLIGCGGVIGTYADLGMLRLAYTERDANVPVQVSIVGGQDKKIAADYLGAVTGVYPVFAPTVLRNGVSIKTDAPTTYSYSRVSDGTAGAADGGTISLDNTAGSSSKGNVTPSAFASGSNTIKWQLETKVNGVTVDKTVCTLTKDPAAPPVNGGGGGGGGTSGATMPANATISSNTTYAALSSSSARKVTLTAGQSIRVTLVTDYNAGSSTGPRALTAKARYANNSSMTSPTDFGSPVTGTNAHPGATIGGGEYSDPVSGSLIFSQTVTSPGAGDWWVDMQGITTVSGKSLVLPGENIVIEVF